METTNSTRSRALKWLAIGGVWTLFALFFTSQFWLQSQFLGRPVPFLQILVWQLVSGYIWFALTPLILYIARRFPFEPGRWKVSLPVHIVAGLLIGLVQLGVDAFLLTRLGYPPGFEFQ